MITPSFTITQDAQFLFLELKTPFVKSNSVEMDIHQDEFKFHAYPYFLRLHFSHSLMEDDRCFAKYDLDAGIIHIRLSKLVENQEFKDLDLLTKLMEPKQTLVTNASKRPMIQVVQENDQSLGDSNCHTIDDMVHDDSHCTSSIKVDDYTWDWPQELLDFNASTSHYGFNNIYSGHAPHIHALAHEILDVSNLDSSTPISRRKERLLAEDLQFDPEHYMYALLYVDLIFNIFMIERIIYKRMNMNLF